MPLTPEEQQELSQLHQKYGQSAGSISSGLNPDEQQEFAQLHAKYGQAASPSSVPSYDEIVNRPGPGGDVLRKTINSIQSGGTGQAVGEGVSALGKLLRGGGDRLMQGAIGASKYIPGFGEDLAKQGIIGTKSAMQGQIARGLGTSGQQISELANQIPGQIPLDAAANKVAAIADTKMTPSGFVRPEDQPVVNKVLSKAQELATSEPVSGSELAARRVVAGRSAREAGAYKANPSSQLKSKVAQAEQAGYSEALKKAYADSFPNAPEALADADKQYSVLSKAGQSINKPESLGGLKDFFAQYLPTSLVQSTAGRTAIGTGKAVGALKGGIPSSLHQMLTPKDNQ